MSIEQVVYFFLLAFRASSLAFIACSSLLIKLDFLPVPPDGQHFLFMIVHYSHNFVFINKALDDGLLGKRNKVGNKIIET
jgi:hypothetical protein